MYLRAIVGCGNGDELLGFTAAENYPLIICTKELVVKDIASCCHTLKNKLCGFGTVFKWSKNKSPQRNSVNESSVVDLEP
jgi:hypothetical protein